MDVSIIIINFNSSTYTINCIKSIFKHTNNLDFEIIIVDNNSAKKDIDALENSILDQKITLIKSKLNLGFGGGNTLGYQYATGKYLAFLNNDILLLENSLLIVKKFIETDGTIGVVSINQVDENNKPFKYSYRQFAGLKYQLIGQQSPQKYYAKKHKADILKTPFEVDSVSGAFMFFNTKKFELSGGFDPNIFLFYEEMDICKRLSKNGFKTMFYPKSTFIHFQGKSSSNIKMKNEFTLSYLYVIQKNYNYWHYLLIKYILLFKYGFKSIIKPKKYFSAFTIILKGGNSLVYSMKI